MPVNRNALIRYRTIDQCLQNRFKKWTLDDLIDACSDAIYEYQGIDKGVSRRTIQGDIEMISRQGKPAVFNVLAGEMHNNGYVFYLSENKVWLSDMVPAQFLKLVE
jgi:hypothetical protein